MNTKLPDFMNILTEIHNSNKQDGECINSIIDCKIIELDQYISFIKKFFMVEYEGTRIRDIYNRLSSRNIPNINIKCNDLNVVMFGFKDFTDDMETYVMKTLIQNDGKKSFDDVLSQIDTIRKNANGYVIGLFNENSETWSEYPIIEASQNIDLLVDLLTHIDTFKNTLNTMKNTMDSTGIKDSINKELVSIYANTVTDYVFSIICGICKTYKSILCTLYPKVYLIPEAKAVTYKLL